MAANLTPSVRISVTGGENNENATDDKAVRMRNRQQSIQAAAAAAVESANTKRDKETKEKERKDGNSGGVVVTNPMSVSVPNLSAGNNTIESTGTAGLLETFAAMARRRTLGSVSGNASSGNDNQTVISSNSNANNSTSTNHGNSLFPRGPSSVSSLVRLALSSNFPGTIVIFFFLMRIFFNYEIFYWVTGGLLSTAQSYPSLTSSGPTGTGTCVSTTAGTGPCLSQALTMSLTSTSSESEQVSFEVKC